jgi:hypothetical protein
VGEGGAGATFGAGARGGGFGLGEGAGGGGEDEEAEGAVGELAEDTCSFASRFIRIWGTPVSEVMRGGRDTYAVSIIGGIGQRLVRAHGLSGFSTQERSDGCVRSIVVSLPDGR